MRFEEKEFLGAMFRFLANFDSLEELNINLWIYIIYFYFC